MDQFGNDCTLRLLEASRVRVQRAHDSVNRTYGLIEQTHEKISTSIERLVHSDFPPGGLWWAGSLAAFHVPVQVANVQKER